MQQKPICRYQFYIYKSDTTRLLFSSILLLTVLYTHVWQSRVEIEGYFVAYFDRWTSR